jgi:hypothetical protein
MGDHSGECPFEFSDVVSNVRGDKGEHFIGDMHGLTLGLGAQDGETSFEIWRIDLDEESREQSTPQAVF